MSIKYKTNQTLVDSGFRQPSGNTLTLFGNTIIGDSATFRYNSDMSGTYTARSVVDAEYVTGKTSYLNDVGSPGQLIYRGNSGITGAVGVIFNPATSGVTVPTLYISKTPANDTCYDFVLSWDENSKMVHKIPFSGVSGLVGALNGLTVSNRIVCLGGPLTMDTSILGNNNSSFRFCDLCGFCTITTSNNIVLDSRCNSGGIYLKSQKCACTAPTNYSDGVGIIMDYQIGSGGLKIIDNRTGSIQTGIEYAANYSTNYTNRSLVDKEFVMAVASGLNPKQAVQAVATTNIDLSGGTFGGSIDGISILDGDRVLIQNQTLGKDNGIYVYSGGSNTFIRSNDFNESSEVIQGASTFVLSGTTWTRTTWVLVTPNPITVGVTPISFVQFSSSEIVAPGHGINIQLVGTENVISVDGNSLAGNSIVWSGSSGSETFNVDIQSGTLKDALYYNLDSPSTVTVGGLNAGSTLTGKTANELLKEILVPYLVPAFTSFSNNITSPVEVGCVISGSKSFSWSISNFGNVSGNSMCIYDVTSGVTLATNISVSSPQSVTICNRTFVNCGDTQSWRGCAKNTKGNNFVSSNYTICSLLPYYWGKCTCPGPAGSNRPVASCSMVLSGTKVLANSSASISINFNSGADDYIWFAIPQTVSNKVCWCVTALNNGAIGGGVSPGCNLFPTPDCNISVSTACWSNKDYKVYISNKQTSSTATMTIS